MPIDLRGFASAEECLHHVSGWLTDPHRTIEQVRAVMKMINEQTKEHVDLVQNAMGIIRNRKGELLLLKRRKDARAFPDSFSFPGGKWEEGDLNLEETMMREVIEETGLRVRVLSCSDMRYTTVPRRKRIFEVAVFRLTIHAEDLQKSIRLSDEHERYVWARPHLILAEPANYVLSGSIIQELIQEEAQISV
jgi:8-oxo-dGTP pyrophosphatase MutT (NUDIX family)